MNVVYALSHLEDWVGFAKEMKKRLNWEPRYWVCTWVTEGKILKHFPDCYTHYYLSIIKGESVGELDLFAPAGIDEDLIREYAVEMDLAMKMMDRLDSGDGFSYNERKFFFLKLLNYAHNVLSKFEPELAIFTEIPHHVAQYVLYVVLKKNGVKTLMFKPNTTLGVRLLIYNDIYDDPIATMGQFKFSQEVDSHAKTAISEFIESKRGDYSRGIPDTIKSLHNQSSQTRAVFATLKRLLNAMAFFRIFDKSKFSTVRKLRGVPLEESEINKAQLYWLKWKGFRKQKKLRRKYDVYSTYDINFDEKFIYIPLHYQPERTTSPDGGIYVEQLIMIQLLRSCLPREVTLVVKEHKSQFIPKREGHLSRFEFHYKALKEMSGVKLAPLETDPFVLLDKCWFVATVVGTAGLEAIARGKPAIVFGGGCWYRSLEGVFYVKNRRELKVAIDRIINGVVIQEDSVKEFMMEFYQKSFAGVILPTFRRNQTEENNVKLMADSVEKYVRHVFHWV
tara:strand:- start:29516 stop:31033 length:1518 start_codon:yes stop_codon:yes gene_type:complete